MPDVPSTISARHRPALHLPLPAIGRSACCGAALLLLLAPARARAEDPAPPPTPAAAETPAPEAPPQASFFGSTTVTATGSERDTFQVATPVSVVTAREIERLAPDNAADLLREQPGVDVNGVGPNQARPVIRGQRGLRVLFLEDGLRLNNARRQSDFGEISGLIDVGSVSSVEVVRGPASVLYGSDAIGGVLNLVTGPPSFAAGLASTGGAELRYGSTGESARLAASVAARRAGFDAQLGANYRSADDYEAPAGSFGDVTLDEETPVLDSGLDDLSAWAHLAWSLTGRQSLRLRVDRYRAEETGFGLVEPQAYAPGEDRIRIFYPYQDFDRVAAHYLASALDLAAADSLDLKIYRQDNERQLGNDILAFDPAFGPFFVVDIDTLGATDLETLGLRLEAVKAIAQRHLVTWGAEAFEDDSTNSDFSHTFVGFRFPFPPFEVAFVDAEDDVANAPNATHSSWGVFVQDEWSASARLRLNGGLRYQKTSTEAESTRGWDTSGLDFDDDAVVGSLTATWQLRPELNLLASYGTAFRAPNIVERLFNGVTPEGSGYQILNPGLESERSDNVDLGVKYRRRNAFLELVAFRTEIDDGIVQHFLTDDEIAALPDEVRAAIDAAGAQDVVQQRNADRLRYQGLELAAGYRTGFDLTLGVNYTHLDAERLDSTNPPTGDTYGDKYVAFARWEPRRERFWTEYRLRHNDSTRANLDAEQPVPPVGTTLPGFTVHGVAFGARLFENGRFSHEIRAALENLTDELYAEFSNASFFRPEPGRGFSASYRLRF